MISDAVELDAAEAIDSARAYADALKSAADSLAGLQDKSAALDFSGAGPDKLVASWEAAAGQISASIDKITASLGRLDDLGAAGAGGADKIAASWDDAAGSVSASLDKITASAGKLDDVGAGASAAADEVKGLGAAGETAADGLGAAADAGKGLADAMSGLAGSGAGAGDALKGAGAGADAAAAQFAALRAEIAATSAEADKFAAGAAADATIGAGKASAVYAEALPSLGTTSIEQDAAVAQAQQARSAATKQAAADAEEAAGKYKLLGLAGAAAAAVSVDMAAKFQTATDRLVTSAGESKSNLAEVQKGILGLSVTTATSAETLASGAYWVESAGFHGKNALAVLKAGAEGAKAEGADLPTVANALTTVLTDYGMTSKDPAQQGKLATTAMNEIIAAVGQGKMTTQGLASALPTVLPTAKMAGLSLPQVLGSLASMTAQGTSPEEAGQELKHTIGAVAGPSGTQRAEMQMLGINPNQLADSLGKQGLTGVVAEADAAIKAHTKDGMVQLDTMNQSRLAMQSANDEIAALPRNLQGAAKEFLGGTMSQSQWYALTSPSKSPLSTQDVNLLKQFQTTADSAKGYNALVKAGGGDKQTELAALKDIFGGQVGGQVAMMLGDSHLGASSADVDKVGESAKKTGDNIKNWNLITKQFGFQMDAAKNSVEAVGITAGTALLPMATDAIKAASAVGGFLASHSALTKDLALAGVGLGAVKLAPTILSAAGSVASEAGKVGQVLGIPGSDKVAGLGKGTSTAGADAASGSLDKVAGAGDAAAAALDRVGAAGDKAATGESAAGAAGDKAAIGEDAAGAAGDKAAIGEDAAGVAGGKAGTLLTAGLGLILSKSVIDSLENKKNPKVLGNTNPHSPWNEWPTATDHDDSVIGELMSHWDKGNGPGGAVESSQMQSRFGALPGASLTPAAAPKIAAPDVSSLDAAKAKVAADITQINDAISKGKAAKIPAPDLSALDQARSKAETDLKSIDTALNETLHPAKIPAPSLSGFDGARAAVAADAAKINAAAQTPLAKPVIMAAPNLTPLADVAAHAKQDGMNASLGLAQGIESEAGAAVAAADAVASQVSAAMKSALQTRSPSKVTEAIGKDTAAGLVVGLEGGQSAVNAAATALGKNAAKATDIASIDSNVAKLKAYLPGDSGLTKMLTADQAKLTTLANKRQQLETEITDSQQIAQQALSNASILNAGSYTPALAANGPQASSLTVSGLQAMEADQKQFATQIGQLQKEGLNSTSLDQLVQGGATSGLPVTAGLVGNKSAITQINQLEAQIKGSAAKLGDEGAPAMYQAGVQAGQGLAQGIESQLGTVDAAIKTMAQQMVNSIKSALKSHSPSLVFAEIGMSAPQGMAMGVDQGAPMAVAAVGRMGSRMTAAARAGDGSSHPGLYMGHAGGPGSGGGTTVHITNNITVQGSVTAMQDLHSSLAELNQERAFNNWQAGWTPASRAG